jgi:uncharacterized protein (DUF1778 family)
MSGYTPYMTARVRVSRESRIELRTTAEEKRLLATAAAYERLDVTKFILRNALDTAREVIDRVERIILTEQDSLRVQELLEHPPRPSEALLAAVARRPLRP